MDLQTIQLELEKAVNGADVVYANCAASKAKFARLDAQEKSKLAVLCMKFGGSGLAENKVTRLALASEEYQEFLEDLAWARAEYLSDQSAVSALETKVDLLRSLNKNYLGEFESTKSFQ